MIIDLNLFKSGKITELNRNEVFEAVDNPIEDLGFKVADKINIKYSVKPAQEDFIVSVKYQISLLLNCDKCGVEYKQKFNNNLNLLLVYNIQDELKDDENVILIDHSTNSVDLQPYVREHILVSLPYVNKCKDNCLGLCQYCGVNLNLEKCDCAEENTNPAFAELLK